MTCSLIAPISSPEATDADRFGPKAANLARLGRAGLPIPDGFCVDAETYRAQVAALGLTAIAHGVDAEDPGTARRAALAGTTSALTVVRSSALVEDRFGSSFAGQFESYLGLEGETDFITAVRSCWAALWSTRVLRYMATHDASPADTAMAVLVQALVSARVSGGGLSRTAEAEVVPDRIVLSRDEQGELALRDTMPGRKFHRVGCAHGTRPVPRALVSK